MFVIIGGKNNKKTLGREGEWCAVEFLDKEGYMILERNYNTDFGEIDIIAEHKGILVLVEVKTRSSLDYGLPCMAVDGRKIEHIKRCGWVYMRSRQRNWNGIRVDIAEVLVRDGRFFVRHLKGVA